MTETMEGRPDGAAGSRMVAVRTAAPGWTTERCRDGATMTPSRPSAAACRRPAPVHGRANANRLVKTFGTRVLVAADKWHVWDGVRWRAGDMGGPMSTVTRACSRAWCAKEAQRGHAQGACGRPRWQRCGAGRAG